MGYSDWTKQTYSHTKLFGNVKPKPIYDENGSQINKPQNGSNLREKFSFNGTNLLSQNKTSTGSKRDIDILQKLFPTVKERLIKAVYNSKGNNDLKLTKQHLTTVVEKRKQEEVLKKSASATPISPAPELSPPKEQIEISSSPDNSPQKTSSKVVLDKKKTISEKYSTNYRKKIDEEDEDEQEQVPAPKKIDEEDEDEQEQVPAPKKRRLIRGSRNVTPVTIDDEDEDDDTPSVEAHKHTNNIKARIAIPKSAPPPPAPLPKQQVSKSKSKPKTINLSDEEQEEEEEVLNDEFSDDSDVAEEESAVVTSSIDEYYEQKTLEFMNSAEDRDIVDVTTCTFEIAKNIVKKRPFRSINQFESFNFRDEEPTRRRNKTDGEIVSQKANLVLRGYAAVDSLVKQCNKYSEKIANEIGKWGVKVHGVNDELEVIDVALSDDDEDDEGFMQSKKSKRNGYFKEKPKYLANDVDLKNYQQVGINWLSLLYKNNLSCILADEMGLGKTCQVIAFLSHLKETGIQGPHLVVVPSSTLENWMREFRKFAPSFVVEPYYGSQSEREEMREILTSRLDEIDVIVTTYNLATGNKDDASFLKHAGFNVIVYDEGHMLKNSSTDRFQKLMKIKAKFRLLLTVKKLVLMIIILVIIHFYQKEPFPKLRKMMAPFILRRRKDQVLQHLPPKVNEIETCELFETQSVVYKREIQRGIELKEKKNKTANVLMGLRKAAIHPLLFRYVYTDDILKKMSKEIMKEPVYCDANQQYIYEDMEVMTDFELNKLCEQFPTKDGKILIFSLFTQVLDILERVLSEWSIKFLRLDGGTSVDIRQDIIDKFYEEKTIPVFLLSTKAGGFGINLVCANTVIIFDQSFNPHDDKQAEDRAHRVGQVNPVKVIRLITKGTIEENMYQLAKNKLELDKSMSGEQIETKAVSYIEQMIFEDKDVLKGKVEMGSSTATPKVEEVEVLEDTPESVSKDEVKTEVKPEVKPEVKKDDDVEMIEDSNQNSVIEIN
ncbi:unnamed protein product [Wickerhamomyces anomalus]